MKRYKIAILDSGCNNIQMQNLEIICKKNLLDNSDDVIDENGHGTATLYIVNSIVPKSEYIILKVLDKNAQSKVCTVLAALEYLLSIEVDYICICLSTSIETEFNKMYTICQKLRIQGKYLIASQSNSMEKSYPAEFDNVLGVTGILMKNQTDFWFNKKFNIQVVSDLTPIMVPDKNYEKWHMFGGNSKATALMCGLVAKNADKHSIEEYLDKYCNKNMWTFSDITERKIYDCKLVKGTISDIMLYEMLLLVLSKYDSVIENYTNLHTLFSAEDYYDVLCMIEEKIQISFDFSKFKYSDFDTIMSLYQRISSIKEK